MHTYIYTYIRKYIRTYIHTYICSKIIFALSRSAKLNWGLSHKALKTLYTGGIQPLLLYGAPVWAETVEKAIHRKKLINVQRLINIRIAKAYRTVSNDALCIITGLTPIHIKNKKWQNYTE
jgi:2-iminoacetate synthase ThiH